MRPKKVIKTLQESIKVYEPFWEDWSQAEAFPLSSQEKVIISFFSEIRSFTIYDYIQIFGYKKKLLEISTRLKDAFQNFKEWLVGQFLFTILSITKNRKYKMVKTTPILYSNLPYQLKFWLSQFSVIMLHDLFFRYNEEDLLKDEIFKKVVGFQCAYLKVLTLNDLPMD